MNHDLEFLIRLLELLYESQKTGYAATLATYRKACEHYAIANGITTTAVMEFVEKMHRKKLASENKRAGRPGNA